MFFLLKIGIVVLSAIENDPDNSFRKADSIMVYEPETILYALSDDLYSEDSPVLFCHGVLKKKAGREEPVVALELRNLSDQPILDMKLELLQYPGEEIIENRFQTGLSPEETITWEIPVFADAISFSIKRIGIIFEDSSFWVGRGNSFRALPQVQLVQEEEKDLQLFREKTTEQSAYIPQDLGPLWRCSCGELNKTTACRRCGMEKDTVFEEYYKCDRKIDCPKCGAVITVGSKFCPYCGEEILEWKYHKEERTRDERSFQERLRELIAAVQEHAPIHLRRPWWFWLVLITALIIGLATILSIGRSAQNGGRTADAVVSEMVETPLDQIKKKAVKQAEVEFGTGEYEIVADKDKKIFYVNGWPDKAYADLNRARTNEKEGMMQWTLWSETVQSNCETLREYMDEKGYDDWGCSWSIRSNRNHGTVFLTVFDGNILYDDLEYQK